MYKCNKCGYQSKNFFGLCPKCNEGFAEETILENDYNLSYGKNKLSKQIKDYEINKVDKKVGPMEFEKRTKYDGLNEILSTPKGFVKRQVIALGAQPGIGKSTLCTNISDDETLYISTEESYNQVNSRFVRINPESKADILCTKDLDIIMDAISKTDKKLIIVDSLNNVNSGLDSYVKQAQNAGKLTDIAKQKDKIMIIICQVARNGEISGMNSLLHVVDTVLYLERSAVSSNLILTSNKNRFGEIGSITMFEHTENGLIEIKEQNIENQIGSTIMTAQFGVKKIPVCIEALVAPASMTYGLRRSNGIPQQRIQQILAILQTNSKGGRQIDFTNKDVYVSVAYGLSINDTNSDLAIANSILSSLFQKTIDTTNINLVGEISLNGYIKGNKSSIKHITDLINLYLK